MNKETKLKALDTAVEITKEFGRGGHQGLTPAEILRTLYKKIIELKEDALTEEK